MILRASSGSGGARVERHPELAGEGVVVGCGVGLAVVLRLGDHDAVDQRPGDQHALRGAEPATAMRST